MSIYGELAQESVIYRSDLAMALNNLGNQLADIGRAQDALAPANPRWNSTESRRRRIRPSVVSGGALHNVGTA